MDPISEWLKDTSQEFPNAWSGVPQRWIWTGLALLFAVAGVDWILRTVRLVLGALHWLPICLLDYFGSGSGPKR